MGLAAANEKMVVITAAHFGKCIVICTDERLIADKVRSAVANDELNRM